MTPSPSEHRTQVSRAFAVTPILAQMAPPAAAPPPPEIRDIAPPIDVFPYPPWMVALAALVALALIGVAVWFAWRWWRTRPQPPPPSPRSIALRELGRLRNRVQELDPHAFSFGVSDVLRTYIGAQYGLRAREQTSPEFLAAISAAPRFSDGDRTLLARFLERADMIKFARINASTGDSSDLLNSATDFVQGGEV